MGWKGSDPKGVEPLSMCSGIESIEGVPHGRVRGLIPKPGPLGTEYQSREEESTQYLSVKISGIPSALLKDQCSVSQSRTHLGPSRGAADLSGQ